MKQIPCSGQVHPVLSQYIGYCFYRVALRIRGFVDQELKPHGVVAPQCAMLAILIDRGTMSQVELGSYVVMDKATMVRMLDGLEKLGLVKRVTAPEDRRSRYLHVTAKGKKVHALTSKARDRAEKKALSVLSVKERKQFKALVQKVLAEMPAPDCY